MKAAMQRRQQTLRDILGLAPVVAVVVVENIADAVPMASALVAGGIPAIEITLRTPVALEAIAAVARDVDGAVVGAGTVLGAHDLQAARRAGAQFAVSPGATPELLAAAADGELPLLPGAATASEAMALREQGYLLQKFFPAEAAGGADYLGALAGPLPGIGFCPTGGVRIANAPAYLALPNVICVGGSWLTPDAAIRNGDWAAITQLARAAAALRGGN